MTTGSGFERYGKTLRVEGGLRAQSTRGAIGESWWSKRFLAVLESFALGSRLTRGRNYARAGQVLSLTIAPGLVSASVQGSRPSPYAVSVKLKVLPDKAWQAVEQALASQALFTARLLAGDMPAEIEEVFSAAGAPLFPTGVAQLDMRCSCPDYQVPCKHLAATFYLLAEAFDADPFEILHWRGRDKETLLATLRTLRGGAGVPAKAARTRTKKTAVPLIPATGASAALAQVASPDLAETVDRFWVAPVPLPARPTTLDTEVDLLLRQLPTPPAPIGGTELAARLRELYQAFRRAPS
jgi:uncharacterized Zn finger protein